MDENEEMQPFWLQTNEILRRHRRRRPPSFLLNSGVLLLILLVTAFALMFLIIIVPTFRNFRSEISSPVKKGWDSLNIILVLFAIVCGFLSRNSNNTTEDNLFNSVSSQTTTTPTTAAATQAPVVVGYQDQALLNAQLPNFSNANNNGWYDGFSDRGGGEGASLTYRMPSCGSYSDLRQPSLCVQSYDQWGSFDHTHLQSSDQLNTHDGQQQLQRRGGQESHSIDPKSTVVETHVVDQLNTHDGQQLQRRGQESHSIDPKSTVVETHVVDQQKEDAHVPMPEVVQVESVADPGQHPPAEKSLLKESQLYKHVIEELQVNKEGAEDVGLNVDAEPAPEVVVLNPTRRPKSKRKSRRTYADVAEKAKANAEVQPRSEDPLPPPLPLQRTVKHEVRNVESLLPEVVVMPQEKPVDVVKHKHRTRRSYEDIPHAKPCENEFKVMNSQHERARGKHRSTRSSEDVISREDLERLETRQSGHKSEKTRGSTKKELFNFLNHQRRKKKKQSKIVNLVSSESSLQHLHHPPSSPPSPPPPPHPDSLLHNWLHRKGKTKKVHTIDPSQPRVGSTTKRPSKMRTQVALSQFQPYQVSQARPPLPGKTSTYFSMNDNPSSGDDSPLQPIPPPPPLPSFKMPGQKLGRHDDFVRVTSFNSSRGTLPDLYDEEASARKEGNESAVTLNKMQNSGSSQQASFCPSPDVNTKADMFIERVRAGFKNEKAKSYTERRQGRERKSRLSREASPGLDKVGSGQ